MFKNKKLLENKFGIYKSYKAIIILIIIFYFIYNYIYNNSLYNYNYKYLKFKNKIKRIKIGIVVSSLKNGGTERQTSLILYYFSKIKIFDLFLFTKKRKEKDEYIVDNKIKRFIFKKNNLINILIDKKIDILIFQFYDIKQIKKLNKIKDIKTILINRSCFLHWIYYKIKNFYKTYYPIYNNTKYIISLIPFESDF